MKLIEEEELAALVIASLKLRALESGGVTNWNGYDLSLHYTDEGKKWGKAREISNKELLRDYRNA